MILVVCSASISCVNNDIRTDGCTTCMYDEYSCDGCIDNTLAIYLRGNLYSSSLGYNMDKYACKVCSYFIANCLNCISSQTTSPICTACLNNSYALSSTQTCSLCSTYTGMTNCVTCSNRSTCTSCVNNSYAVNNVSLCTLCPVLLAECI